MRRQAPSPEPRNWGKDREGKRKVKKRKKRETGG